MASTKRLRGTPGILLEILQEELRQKNEQIRSLQAQLQILLDDKFFKPAIRPVAEPNANRMTPRFADDVSEFDPAEDARLIGQAIDDIAKEQGLASDWAKEHAQ